ncbi:MAG: response regulator [Lentisphaeria bacterium]|nr:response regulator [Lentisphaeria bacterium]
MDVVIVDDALLIQMHLKSFFKNVMKYNVVATGNDGIAAVELYKDFKPDLLTLDLSMPNKNGTDALREILEFDPKARVIICSAITDANKITETLNMGACCYIKKPLIFSDPEYILQIKEDIAEALED